MRPKMDYEAAETVKTTDSPAVAPPAACSAFSRLEAIARAAVGHPRFTVSSVAESVHVTLDGWDVGTYEKASSKAGLNGTQVDLAENILGLENEI